MPSNNITIVITPRERYSGIIECIDLLYKNTTEPFNLIIIDLNYPQKIKREINHFIATKKNTALYSLGLITPMSALKVIRHKITTAYTILLDNDSRVSANWLPPLIDSAIAENIAIVNPLTLEKDGVDKGAQLRSHLYTAEIRTVAVNNKSYLIEHKTFRRALPAKIPNNIAESDTFELHCVLFKTNVLKEIDIPSMVIREHIDLSLQVRNLGLKIITQPKSVIIFDNLGTRMTLSDMKFFFFRWHKQLTFTSAREFKKRWGYDFYSEQAMYHWVFRRKIFLICRWLYLPVPVANLITRIAAKLKSTINPVWDPLSDPISHSKLLEHDK